MYTNEKDKVRVLLLFAVVGVIIIFLMVVIFSSRLLGGNTTSTAGVQVVSTVTHVPTATPTSLPTATPTPQPPAPMVADAGFETPAFGNGYQYNVTGTAWSFNGATGGGSGIAGNQSGFTSGNPPAPEGTQVAFLQANGAMSQSIHFAAGSYVVAFQAAQRQNTQTGGQDFQVMVDGNVVGSFVPTDTNYASYTTNPFTVTAGDHIVTFQGLDTKGGDNTAFIDAVNIYFA